MEQSKTKSAPLIFLLITKLMKSFFKDPTSTRLLSGRSLGLHLEGETPPQKTFTSSFLILNSLHKNVIEICLPTSRKRSKEWKRQRKLTARDLVKLLADCAVPALFTSCPEMGTSKRQLLPLPFFF